MIVSRCVTIFGQCQTVITLMMFGINAVNLMTTNGRYDDISLSTNSSSNQPMLNQEPPMAIIIRQKFKGSVYRDQAPGNEVMRISSVVIGDLASEHPEDTKYFHIEKKTGALILDKPIDREPGYQFELKVTGRDRTDSTATFPIALEILVADDKVNTLVGKESASCDSDTRLKRSLHNGAKLRHSRHLHGAFNEDFGTSRATVSSTSHDNHKPVFTNCSKYSPSVKEEEPPGTFVTQVQATDKDPPDNGGKITYSFVSGANERNKFRIDPETGDIYTTKTFDRDEPERVKEVYLIVRASDNGSPRMDDACTIKVTIMDINDNAPVFDKVSYMEAVPQDLALGKEIMRISATDIDDGKNSLVHYDIEPKKPEEAKYFHIEKTTGVIILDNVIDKEPGYHFKLRATATDQGDEPTPLSSSIELDILVVESNKKAPTFKSIPASPIKLKENLMDFDYNIATLSAVSNDDGLPMFELTHGRTEQTNKLHTFRMESEGENAYIRLGKVLDFELISEYMLTIRVRNKYALAVETVIGIQVEDVNDNIPMFTELESGSVLENEPPGTPVMQVRAIDADSSPEHNQVSYELADNKEYFAIDKHTGNITTLVSFDREKNDSYNVKVYAYDNSPSSLYTNNLPNKGEQVFIITIADKNDHPPKFTKEHYVADAIREDANLNALVVEVNAVDKDTASPVTYSIMEGNDGDAFMIEKETGRIRVHVQLDYEKKTKYTLKVRAFDGYYQDFADVDINIKNVNDSPPVFEPFKNNITIEEEQLQRGCIMQLYAYDPDIQDRQADQHIVFTVVPKQDQEQNLYLNISKDGCLFLLKPLDRDPPNGNEVWQELIKATDNDGVPQPDSPLAVTTPVFIHLIDINDNAPFLDMPGPVVWRENQEPGKITTLLAKDNDGPENGAPFKFSIANSAGQEVLTKFGVSGDQLIALTTFDREEKKSYKVQIAITDNGKQPMTGTSTLTVVIGDVNDNTMKEGSSNIFVYNYKGMAPDMEIGRVYVEDLDDWDLPDKTFNWADGKSHPHFDLSTSTGMITMQQGTPGGSYQLHFEVTEQSPNILYHKVNAEVNVTVKEIPEEAVDKSGSIRLSGISAEEFIIPDLHGSKKDLLQAKLAHFLNTSLDNIDVFTVLHSPHNTNQSQLDVRFSAHGSPYYPSEKINAAITEHRTEFENVLGVKILMVSIDECLVEKQYCSGSCSNFLNKSNMPSAVYTNTTSFIGVLAVVDPYCTCNIPDTLVICHNGGTPLGDTCECLAGYEGPHCESVSIGFYGDGWALYPPFSSCDNSQVSLEINTDKPSGLIFYLGPTNPDSLRLLGVQDFISLELHEGYPVLLVDFGSGTVRLEHRQIRVSDGKLHRIDIFLSTTTIEMLVDNCKTPLCLSLTAPVAPNKYLNVNGPLQVGGTHMKLASVAVGMNWSYQPHDEGFVGCVRNLTFNGRLYNLGSPSLSKNTDPSCNKGTAYAVTFGIDTSFLVAILICLAILLILLLAVVVHRKKTDDWSKDTDDIRENIINYEDEGGGEGDMTGYDLNVLRFISDYPPNDKQISNTTHLIPRTGHDDVPDICGFLDGKKQSVDNDPETNPFDDVRHYAYEGDGNTTGSLSSLASGTDEGDLNFDYLSNFGPRFRKLADMYGEDPSDEEDDNFHNAASESWC